MSNENERLFTNQDYHDRVTWLFDSYYIVKKASDNGESIPVKARLLNANDLIEHYIGLHGKRPPNSVLSRLAVYILLDDLSDSHPDKLAREEYPIASYGQTGRYFERNQKLSDNPYAQEDVTGINGDGEEILNANTGEWKAADWRLFLREVLTEREVFIIEGIYERGETQAEVAEKLGVSRQRVGAILYRILTKLGELITD